eukprot:730691-Pyramimonas_sp.AAC.1
MGDIERKNNFDVKEFTIKVREHSESPDMDVEKILSEFVLVEQLESVCRNYHQMVGFGDNCKVVNAKITKYYAEQPPN